jgi:hypothetical protein
VSSVHQGDSTWVESAWQTWVTKQVSFTKHFLPTFPQFISPCQNGM